MSADATHAQLKQAYALIKAKQSSKAIAILSPIVASEPDNLNAWWLLANAQSDPAKARAALEQVLRLNPQHAGAQKQLNALSTMQPWLANLSSSDNPPAATSTTQPAVDFYSLASGSPPPPPDRTPAAPTSPNANSNPSKSETVGAGCGVLLLSIPIGGYITATLGVIDYLIFAFVTLIMPALTDLNFLGIFLLLVFAIFIVIFGVVIAIAGGVVGLGIGAIIGFVNLVVSTPLSMISRRAAALIAPIVCAVAAVVAYHYLIYQPIMDLAARDSGWYEIVQHKWILDMNYLFAVILGGGISLLGLGAQTPTDPEEAERDLTPEEIENLKKAGGVLFAPWKFFGNVAKGTMGASAYSYSEFNRSVKKDALKQNDRQFKRDIEEIKRSMKAVEEMNREIERIEKTYHS